MIETFAPGKLYIAGEYAVVEPGHPAVLVAIDQFMRVRLREVEGKDAALFARDLMDQPTPLQRNNQGEAYVENQESTYRYVLATINLIERYVRELGGEIRHYKIDINSQLQSHGIKYGTGSSAAVVVAVTKSLNELYQLNLGPLEIFKCASLVHVSVQGNGSCGDIAASVAGGTIAFSTFNRTQVLRYLASHTVKQTIDWQWPGLSIEPISLPDSLELLVGWSGMSAATAPKVAKAQQKSNDKHYQEFLQSSTACVRNFIAACKANNSVAASEQIRVNRQLLGELENITGVSIETPALKKLCDIAVAEGAVAKSSGAGGGDCAIALAPRTSSDIIRERWEKAGFAALPLHITQSVWQGRTNCE